MAQHRIVSRSNIWPVVFPEEKLIVKRPCLRYICQGNTHLGELLSYFLYEVGKEAAQQGIDPLLVHSARLYRTQEEILHGIDHSLSARGLGRYIVKLAKLGYLQAVPHQHMYLIQVEMVRQEVATHEEDAHVKYPHASLKMPPTVFQIAAAQQDNTHKSAKVPDQSVKVPDQSAKQTQFDIGFAPTTQAVLADSESAPRYNKDTKEIKKEIRDEASAIVTHTHSSPSFSFSTPKPPSPQKEVQDHRLHTEEQAVEVRSELFLKDTVIDAVVADCVPEKPAGTMLPTIETFLALADHYRGYRLPNSKKSSSQYRMALEAATILVKRKKSLAEVDAVFAYMKGVNVAFCDDWWSMQTVDLWHVARHFDSMVKKMVHRRTRSTVASAVSQVRQISQTSEMVALMEMPLAERKIYLSQHREQMQQKTR